MTRVCARDVAARNVDGSLRLAQEAATPYAFAVPPTELDDVRLVVHFDGVHGSTQLRGRVEVRR